MKNSMLNLAAVSRQEEIVIRGGADKDLQELFRQFGYGLGLLVGLLMNLAAGAGGCSRQV